jgi:hypothetical protein
MGLAGYVRASVAVLGPGDEQVVRDEQVVHDGEKAGGGEGGLDDVATVLMPDAAKLQLKQHILRVAVDCAEGLPQMDSGQGGGHVAETSASGEQNRLPWKLPNQP